MLKKYEILVREWNAMALAIAIYFSASLLGLVAGLIFGSWQTVLVMLLVMAMFAVFEFRIRRAYIAAKADIERQLGLKKDKGIIRGGLLW